MALAIVISQRFSNVKVRWTYQLLFLIRGAGKLLSRTEENGDVSIRLPAVFSFTSIFINPIDINIKL